jgi:CDP-diacylglycerol--glycerol-3-phosphate 3-phosphatidyltransferase
MTTANKVTIFRILLVPFFIVLVLYYVQGGREVFRFCGILVFGLATVSDGVDGYIARRYYQHSELGRMLDPLADKLLLISGIMLLSLKNEPYLDRFPMWLTVTVLSRDVLLLIGLVVIHYTFGRIKVRPVLLGKAATVLQMTCVLWALLKWNSHWLLIWAIGAALCTGFSGLIYVFEGVRQLSTSPTSSPAQTPE